MHILLIVILIAAVITVVLGTYPWPWMDLD